MPRKKILIADDSNTALMMNKMILTKGSFDVVTARDGQEAADVAASEHPDLIVLDVVMPRMTGLEACRVLRQREETRDIPILLVTTRGEEDSVEAGYESGCTDYITKPVNPPELLSKVRSYLEG